MSERARRVLRALFALVVLGFVVAALASQWGEVGDHLDELSPLTLLGGFVLVLAGLVCSMLSWRAVLTDLGSALPLRAAARVFYVGQLGKYLPGSVWPVVTQMELGRDHDVPRTRMAAAGLVSMGFGLTGSLLVAGAALPWVAEEGARGYLWALAVLPVAAVVLHPPYLTVIVNRGLRLLRKEPLEHALSARGVLTGVGWATACWLLHGVQVWLLARDLAPDSGRLFLLSQGGFALAWAVGFLVVIVPGGLGVREGALVVILRDTLGTPAATLLAVVSRLVVTVADLTWAAVAVLGRRAGRFTARDHDS